jgi:phosphoglycerate dehydrogenase-like enzyme
VRPAPLAERGGRPRRLGGGVASEEVTDQERHGDHGTRYGGATVARSIDILTHVSSPEVDAIARDFPSARLVPIPLEGPLPREVSGEVCLTLAWGSPNMADVIARGVRWVHTIGTGVDRFPLDTIGDAVLTCSRGASAIPISEWTLAVMLAFEKQLPGSWITSPPERWNIAELGGLHRRRLGLVGLGGIATEVARRALAFGMEVAAFRRSGRPAPLAGVTIESDLDALIAGSDHLVIAAPATPATRHLIDAGRLAHARPGLHLVNIARGSLIDQEALRAALDEGRIALASLDVCDPEPLPEGHWLYRHPRVRLSPHISWSMPGAMAALFDSFRENLRRYLAGDPLLGVVDRARGY